MGSSLLPLLLAGSALTALGPVPAGTVRIVLMRHGQAFTNLDALPSPAPADPDSLTPLGREQVARTTQVLAGLEAPALIASPAGRARETASLVGRALGIEPRAEPRLRPLELGRAPGGGELGWEARVAEWKAGRDPSPPGGESLEDVGRRVQALVEELRAPQAGRTVVLVTHSEVVAAFVGQVEGKPGAARYPPRVPNASLTVVDARGPGELALRLSGYLPEDPPPPRAP